MIGRNKVIDALIYKLLRILERSVLINFLILHFYFTTDCGKVIPFWYSIDALGRKVFIDSSENPQECP